MSLLVTPPREEIPPVLGHEPGADCCDPGDADGRMQELHEEADGETQEQRYPERDFVDSLTQDVHPRPERVLLDAYQDAGRRAWCRCSDPPPTGPVGQA